MNLYIAKIILNIKETRWNPIHLSDIGPTRNEFQFNYLHRHVVNFLLLYWFVYVWYISVHITQNVIPALNENRIKLRLKYNHPYNIANLRIYEENCQNQF